MVTIIVSGSGISPACNEGNLGLGGLGLLAALRGRLFFPHLLAAEGSKATGEFPDLLAGHFLGEGLGELLEEEGVMGLLDVGRDDGRNGGAEHVELGLGGGREDGELGNIDRLGGVLGVYGDGGSLGLGTSGAQPSIAKAVVSKHVGGVCQVGILLGATETLTALGRGLVVDNLGLGHGESLLAGTIGLVTSNARALGLLIGKGLGGGLGLSFFGLLSLFALYFGVFGGIPGVEDLRERGVSKEA